MLFAVYRESFSWGTVDFLRIACYIEDMSYRTATLEDTTMQTPGTITITITADGTHAVDCTAGCGLIAVDLTDARPFARTHKAAHKASTGHSPRLAVVVE